MAAFNNWLANLAEIGQCEPALATTGWKDAPCRTVKKYKFPIASLHASGSCFLFVFFITILKTIMATYCKNLFKDCFWRTCSSGATSIYASAAILLMMLLSSPPVTSVDSNDHFSFLIILESLNRRLLQQKISSLGSVIPHHPGLSITLVKTVFPSLLLTSASLSVF